jgi:hypothetical protein
LGKRDKNPEATIAGLKDWNLQYLVVRFRRSFPAIYLLLIIYPLNRKAPILYIVGVLLGFRGMFYTPWIRR